jgi:hypothetical protein
MKTTLSVEVYKKSMGLAVFSLLAPLFEKWPRHAELVSA